MAGNWKEFEAGPAMRGGMHVTISGRGNICIGAAAFERWGKPDAAVLFYDDENELIGLEPTHPRRPNAFPMNAMRWGRHRIVRANRFCRSHGIKVERMMAFAEPRIDGNMLVLDLKAMIPASKTELPGRDNE